LVANQTNRAHSVPACYSRAWADRDDRVGVKRRGRGKLFTPNVLNVAVDADLNAAFESGVLVHGCDRS
jgi:hypothetical protein